MHAYYCFCSIDKLGGVAKNLEHPFGNPYNKEHSNLGSILGSPCFGKLQNLVLRASAFRMQAVGFTGSEVATERRTELKSED